MRPSLRHPYSRLGDSSRRRRRRRQVRHRLQQRHPNGEPRMKRALFTLALLALGASTFASSNAAQPKLSPKPVGAEIAFVSGIQKDLQARFPTPADAEKAGYFRYTNEDK